MPVRKGKKRQVRRAMNDKKVAEFVSLLRRQNWLFRTNGYVTYSKRVDQETILTVRAETADEYEAYLLHQARTHRDAQAKCACWMCQNKRRTLMGRCSLTYAEQRNLDSFVHQVDEYAPSQTSHHRQMRHTNKR